MQSGLHIYHEKTTWRVKKAFVSIGSVIGQKGGLLPWERKTACTDVSIRVCADELYHAFISMQPTVPGLLLYKLV